MTEAAIKDGKLYIGHDIVSLKAFKYMASLSDETDCFTTKVMLNGVEIGDAENRGGGGPTSVYHSIKNKAQYDKIQTSIKEARLGYHSLYCDDPLTITNLEDVVDHLVNSKLKAKETAKALKKLEKDDYFLIGLKRSPSGAITSYSYFKDYKQNRKVLESNPAFDNTLAKCIMELEKVSDLIIAQDMPDFNKQYLDFLNLGKEIELITLPETIHPDKQLDGRQGLRTA